jgi:hypothetical protein
MELRRFQSQNGKSYLSEHNIVRIENYLHFIIINHILKITNKQLQTIEVTSECAEITCILREKPVHIEMVRAKLRFVTAI